MGAAPAAATVEDAAPAEPVAVALPLAEALEDSVAEGVEAEDV